MAAGQLLKVPSNAEIESQETALQMGTFKELSDSITIAYKPYSDNYKNLSEEEKKSQLSDIQKKVEQIQQNWYNRLSEMGDKLYETSQNKKDQVTTLGLTLSRFSPASSYQLAAMTISGNDVDLKKRTESQMKSFRRKYTAFIQKKIIEYGGNMAYYQSQMAGDSRKNTIDLAELPRFSFSMPAFGEVFAASLFDVAILVILTLAIFAGAYFAFLRYDLNNSLIIVFI